MFHSHPLTSTKAKKKLAMVFQRIVNYWVSTFITEKLLSSPAFHRMAATTHKHVSNVTNKGKVPQNIPISLARFDSIGFLLYQDLKSATSLSRHSKKTWKRRPRTFASNSRRVATAMPHIQHPHTSFI